MFKKLKSFFVLSLFVAALFVVPAHAVNNKVTALGNYNTGGRTDGTYDVEITDNTDGNTDTTAHIVHINAGWIQKVRRITTSDTLGVSESGTVYIVDFVNTGNDDWIDFTLPNAQSGLTYTFISNEDTTITVKPRCSDSIGEALSGYALDPGDWIRSPGTSGDSLTVISFGSNTWAVQNMVGTWTDPGGDRDDLNPFGCNP